MIKKMIILYENDEYDYILPGFWPDNIVEFAVIYLANIDDLRCSWMRQTILPPANGIMANV